MRALLAGIVRFAVFGAAMLLMYGLLDTWPMVTFLGAALILIAMPGSSARRRT